MQTITRRIAIRKNKLLLTSSRSSEFFPPPVESLHVDADESTWPGFCFNTEWWDAVMRVSGWESMTTVGAKWCTHSCPRLCLQWGTESLGNHLQRQGISYERCVSNATASPLSASSLSEFRRRKSSQGQTKKNQKNSPWISRIEILSIPTSWKPSFSSYYIAWFCRECIGFWSWFWSIFIPYFLHWGVCR
jgi:hypothetical protein